MGNSLTRLQSVGQQATRRRLPSAPTPEQQSDLNRIAAQEQARMQHLPDLEQLNSKDEPLDKLLARISGAIQPHVVDISHGQAVAHSKRPSPSSGPNPQGTAIHMSAKDRLPIPDYVPSGQSGQGDQDAGRSQGTRPIAGWGAQHVRRPSQQQLANDDEPGRVQAYVLREVLEAKNLAESQGSTLDLSRFIEEHGMPASQIEMLFKYCAIPKVGKFQTFGHQYAYARPPAWWLRDRKQGTFLSEAAVLEASRQPQAAASSPPGAATSTQSSEEPQTRPTS